MSKGSLNNILTCVFCESNDSRPNECTDVLVSVVVPATLQSTNVHSIIRMVCAYLSDVTVTKLLSLWRWYASEELCKERKSQRDLNLLHSAAGRPLLSQQCSVLQVSAV